MKALNKSKFTNNNSRHFSSDFYYMSGKHTVLSALSNKKRSIKKIFCTQSVFNAHKTMIISHKYEIVSEQDLQTITKTNNHHQGIIAEVRSIFSRNLNELDLTDDNCKLVILDQITDPQNIGAIIRSAAAFNISGIILPEDNAPNENATIAKAASGALEFVKIIKVVNVKQTIEVLKQKGFWVVGLDSNGTEPLTPKLLEGKVVSIFGSEDTGLRKLTAANCDYLVKIPIAQQMESLNVANTAAIVFYLSSLSNNSPL